MNEYHVFVESTMTMFGPYPNREGAERDANELHGRVIEAPPPSPQKSNARPDLASKLAGLFICRLCNTGIEEDRKCQCVEVKKMLRERCAQ